MKATTTGEVRLTPTQAARAAAAQGRFVLCVVDLRGVPPERVSAPWAGADVVPLARLHYVGPRVEGAVRSVSALASADGVRIHNGAYLRYGVDDGVWGAGVSIDEWVDGLPKASADGQPDGT